MAVSVFHSALKSLDNSSSIRTMLLKLVCLLCFYEMLLSIVIGYAGVILFVCLFATVRPHHSSESLINN